MSRIAFYVFLLALVLIGVAYYAGVKTDATAATNGANQLLQTVTGRGANNQFAAYPTGG